MKIEQAIEILTEGVRKAYNESKQCQIAEKIYRGHSASISVNIENEVALFLQRILPKNYEFYIDPSIKIDKTHRPDILIIDNKKNVKAMIELKSNMGYYRNAEEVFNKLKYIHKIFAKKGHLKCSFSSKNDIDKIPSKEITYPKNVKIFLVSYTADNCHEDYHENNKKISKKNNIPYFILFKGWYDKPQEYEIKTFANEIKQICK